MYMGVICTHLGAVLIVAGDFSAQHPERGRIAGGIWAPYPASGGRGYYAFYFVEPPNKGLCAADEPRQLRPQVVTLTVWADIHHNLYQPIPCAVSTDFLLLQVSPCGRVCQLPFVGFEPHTVGA